MEDIQVYIIKQFLDFFFIHGKGKNTSHLANPFVEQKLSPY